MAATKFSRKRLTLRELRHHRGITQVDLFEMTGIKQCKISLHENRNLLLMIWEQHKIEAAMGAKVNWEGNGR